MKAANSPHNLYVADWQFKLQTSPYQSIKFIGFASSSGTTAGKSDVDMSTPWRRPSKSHGQLVIPKLFSPKRRAKISAVLCFISKETSQLDVVTQNLVQRLATVFHSLKRLTRTQVVQNFSLSKDTVQ